MAVSIFHIGLPLDHPSIPVEERPKIAKRLSDLHERMTCAGYKYEITHASPETGLDGFKHQLRTHPCDGVLIGGAVVGDPAMSYFILNPAVQRAHVGHALARDGRARHLRQKQGASHTCALNGIAAKGYIQVGGGIRQLWS